MTLTRLPEPPYFVVIFTTVRTSHDDAGYAETASAMNTLAARQEGFLGVDSTARGEDGMAITASYWRDEASIRDWKQQVDHTAARNMGREKWYRSYTLRVAKVDRAYEFETS